MYTVCQKCGKKLSDPESMRRGYGPECWAVISGIEHDRKGGEEREDIPGQMDIFDFPEYLPEEGKG